MAKGPIAVICATDSEYAELQDIMSGPKVIEIIGRTFLQGVLYGQDCVVIKCGVGKISASATAQILINKFYCSAIIFVGTAGSLAKDVNPGDIVIATSLQHWDIDFSSINKDKEKCRIPYMSSTTFEADENLRNWSIEASNDIITNINSGNDSCFISNMQKLGITSPKVHTGIITTGDSFIASFSSKEKVRSCAPNAVCVEMEGVAVAQCCVELGIPFIVVRIISDKADCEGIIDYNQFCDLVASKYTFKIVERLIKKYSSLDDKAI